MQLEIYEHLTVRRFIRCIHLRMQSFPWTTGLSFFLVNKTLSVDRLWSIIDAVAVVIFCFCLAEVNYNI